MKEKFLENQEGAVGFDALQEKVHHEMEQELKERIETNPKLSDEEIVIGAFWEQIEPQVRDAVKELYRKGYWTFSSGFYGGNIQQIAGFFPLDKETKGKLDKIGVRTSWGSLIFEADEPNLDQIKDKWDKVAALLPERNKVVPLTWPQGVTKFRNKYGDEKRVKQLLKERESAELEMRIERWLYRKAEAAEQLLQTKYREKREELGNHIRFIEKEIEKLKSEKTKTPS